MGIEDTLRTLIREELLALKQDLLIELRPTPATVNTPEYLTTEEAAELGALRERRAGQKLLFKTRDLHAHLAGDRAPDEDLVAARELARLGLR
jgi:hypothetical protein